MASRFSFDFVIPSSGRALTVSGEIDQNCPDYDCRVDLVVDGRRLCSAQLVDDMLHHDKWTGAGRSLVPTHADREAMLDAAGPVAVTA